ncbi:MAG: MFS transporter [Acidobacteriota bacterium]|nr:MFS transporter [Acidobacteriota bacterium]
MNENQSSNQNQAWFALVVLFLINTMNFFDRQIAASVGKPIIDEFKLTDSDFGNMAMAFTLIYAAVGVPLGRWADRGNRSRILSIGVAAWSLFTAAGAAAWNYLSLFVARMLVGVGEASCSPAGNSLIGDLYPASKRARATSIFMLGLPIGIFLSNMFGGVIAKNYGWRRTLLIAAIPGLILAGLAFFIKEPNRGATEAVKIEHEHHTGWEPYRRVLSIPTMWWIILSGALHNFNAYAVNSFMPLYLGRYHGLDVADAGYVSAVVLGAVGVVGLLGGGLAADWARKKSPNGRMLVSAWSLLISTPCVYLALNVPKGSLTSFMILMGVGWMMIYVYYVTVYPAVQDVVEPSLRGTAMALYFFAMYLLGGAFGAKILGNLSDYFAKQAMTDAGATVMAESFRAAGLHSAFYVAPVVSLILAAVLFAGARTVAGDMEKLQQFLQRAAEKARS